MLTSTRYRAGAAGILAFVLAQTFQELAYAFWIPASHGPADDLRIMHLPVDQLRAFLILATIIGLLIPYTALAINRFHKAPMASVLGLIGATVFVVAEALPRSIELFAITNVDQLVMVQQIEHGWFFVTLTSYLLASVAWTVATWNDEPMWHWLAPAAFIINALRLTGRIASGFAGQTWLDALNGRAYYPAVLVVNGCLVAWFILQAMASRTDRATADATPDRTLSRRST
jgi:hypothetical protein